MHDAIKQFARLQTVKLKQRVRMSDVVVQALRNAGFEREDVLEALARGEVPEIDVRRRTPALQREKLTRLRNYIAERGCQPETAMARNLHWSRAEVRRCVVKLLAEGSAILRPFDRPVIVHWKQTCNCATALVPDLVRTD